MKNDSDDDNVRSSLCVGCFAEKVSRWRCAFLHSWLQVTYWIFLALLFTLIRGLLVALTKA